MAGSTTKPEVEVQPVKDYTDEYGMHIRIFPPVGTKEDQARARVRYIEIAIRLQINQARAATGS